jgi:hypothetical protein
MSTKILINETVLKSILQDFGMANMPDTVLDSAQKEFDALKRRQFDPQLIIRDCISVQAAAAEKDRNKRNISDNKLKTQTDPARSFPDSDRRNAYSDKV